jgi:hypothetical protein
MGLYSADCGQSYSESKSRHDGIHRPLARGARRVGVDHERRTVPERRSGYQCRHSSTATFIQEVTAPLLVWSWASRASERVGHARGRHAICAARRYWIAFPSQYGSTTVKTVGELLRLRSRRCRTAMAHDQCFNPLPQSATLEHAHVTPASVSPFS